MNFIDRTGQKLRALTTTSTWERRGKIIFWLCKCDCGTEKWVASSRYHDEHTVDCGCGIGHKEEWDSKQKMVIEGGSKSRLYNVWRSIKERCTRETHCRYHKYGGRGIFICAEWLNSFENFYKDMGDIPFKGAQIDRINNDDGYYKENCRWVTNQQNIWNQGAQSNKISKYKGVTSHKSLTKGIRWTATVRRTLNGEYICKRKIFDSEIEAAEWYNEQAKELFGEHAYLNKIDYSGQ